MCHRGSYRTRDGTFTVSAGPLLQDQIRVLMICGPLSLRSLPDNENLRIWKDQSHILSIVLTGSLGGTALIAEIYQWLRWAGQEGRPGWPGRAAGGSHLLGADWRRPDEVPRDPLSQARGLSPPRQDPLPRRDRWIQARWHKRTGRAARMRHSVAAALGR